MRGDECTVSGDHLHALSIGPAISKDGDFSEHGDKQRLWGVKGQQPLYAD